MPKNKKPKIKVVDYRSVNLAWLIDFKDKVFARELGPEIQLVVARENSGTGSQFEIHEDDTLCVTGQTATVYTVTRPYGDVRTGEVPKSTVAPKPRDDWSTEDVAEYVIKRACLADQCTYLELLEKPRKNVSKREYKGAFVSQARRCRFADLVGALEYFYTLKKADLAKQYIWLDVFSANQPKLTARNVEPAVRKENERQLTEGLHIAIANFEQRVMFMDNQKPLEIALPESEYDRFIVTLKTDYDSIITKTSAVNVEQATCFNPADLEMIHTAVNKESSFQALDDIIKTQLRFWVASTGKLQVEKEEQKAKPDLREVRYVANQSGMTYHAQGDYTNAEQLLRKALCVAEEISEDRESDEVVATQLNNLATLLKTQGKLDKATSLYEDSLCIRRKAYGNDHATVATALNNLAMLLCDKGNYAEAEKLQREALMINKKLLGDEHAEVAIGLNNVAGLLCEQGKLDEAKPLYEEAIAIFKRVHGEEHHLVASGLNNLAGLLQALGKLDEAALLFRQALAIDKKLYGEEHPDVAADLHNLANLLSSQGDYKEAEKLHKQALDIFLKVHGDDHAHTAVVYKDLGNLYRSEGEYARAEDMLKKAVEVYNKTFGNEHPSVAAVFNSMALLLSEQGKVREASAMFQQALDIRISIFGRAHADVANTYWNWADSLDRAGRVSEAKLKWKAACEIYRAALGTEHPTYQQCVKWWRN